MKKTAGLLAAGLLMLGAMAVHAHEEVKPAADIEALFKSPDPKLNANKQVAYRIMLDLLEANHWDDAGKYLSKRYIQHNPQADSGLDAVVTFFTKVMKREPKPIPAKLSTPVVAVIAEGDLVTVMTVRVVKETKDPTKTYTTTWFDTWRFKDGKADEHWDGATRP